MRVPRRPVDEEQRATWIELFFDLVFVFAITQLSSLIVADLTLHGAAEAGFLLLVAWWAWIYTTWTTNWFDPDAGPVRLVLLIGMLAGMLGAIALPGAFGGRALLFVCGYVGMQSVRNGFSVLAADPDDPLRRPLVRVFTWNLAVGAVWLAGALAHGDARPAIWIVALVLDYAGPLAGHWTPGLGRSDPRDWELEPSHFAERVMLFLIIAVGETIVAAGAVASSLDLTPARLLAVVAAFLMSVALWWLYFDVHAERMLAELKGADRERGRLGRDLSYLMVPMIAGIVVCAVGNELVISHPGRTLHGNELVAVLAGPVLYLLGSVAFKLRTIHGMWGRRVVAALVVLAAAPLATVVPAVATWALIVAVLGVLAAAESGLTSAAAAESIAETT